MSATEKLCWMLDERGVEYDWTDRLSEIPSYQSVSWWFNTADKAEFREYHDGSTQLLIRSSKTNLTPEQAVEATLGSCNCSNSERTSDELLPCPFCRGEAHIITAAGESWVLCDECKATTEAHTSRQIAIAAWNRRAES